ncbi:MAG: thioesterase family protein [Maioricimonas sp. JB045]|uniref:acyl-CoA thioesterase n=1 Tax=Maioricimonas sp. JC845 TaxID=3232138 RepID=UPI0034598AE5
MPDEHEMQIRVRYSETDAMGFLHHANYAVYFEMGRTELYRASGGDYRAMEERGFFLVVVQLECRFKRPARYDDLLTLRTRLARRSPAKLEHEYELWRDNELLTTGRSVLACVDRDGNVQPITDERLFGTSE